jgi:hypothetical protein
MKRIVILVLLCVCVGTFAEENVAPAAGSFGLSARIAVLNDFLLGRDYDLFRNPGVGVGLRYHVLDRLMLELILSGGYMIGNNALSPDSNYVSLGGGLGGYYWIPSTSNLSKYIGLQQLIYVYAEEQTEAITIQVQSSLQFGMQYNFNSNFAVFGNFGVGVGFFGVSDASGDHDSRTSFQIMPATVGIVFYF